MKKVYEDKGNQRRVLWLNDDGTIKAKGIWITRHNRTKKVRA